MDDKTYVPGMSENPLAHYDDRKINVQTVNFDKSNNNSIYEKIEKQPTLDTPVVGFLYSISRKGIGEYWPLFLGQNTIGRSDDNDIKLREGTVSDQHACLSVKKMRSTGRLIASIKDVGSKTGMYLNDEELDYDNHVCKNGDLVTIGNNYQLLIILIEADEYGLTISKDFVSVDEENYLSESVQQNVRNSSRPATRSVNSLGASTTTEHDFDPYSGKNRRFAENATIDLNGSGNIDYGGGTEIL